MTAKQKNLARAAQAMKDWRKDDITHGDALKLAQAKWGSFGGNAVRRTCGCSTCVATPCLIDGYDSGGRRYWYGATFREACERAGLLPTEAAR